MFYRLGGGGGVLERLQEYCWMTDASILSMFCPMVFIRCPKPIMFSSMTSKREEHGPAGLDPAHAPFLHQISGRLKAQFLP
ncbi:hypothetical protein ACOSP7_024824 [Xanthoceras sorbifolium]